MDSDDKRYLRLELDDNRHVLVEEIRHLLEEAVSDIKDEIREVLVEDLLKELRVQQAPTP